MSLATFAFRHRAALYLASILVTLAGLFALAKLPAGVYPEATFPRIAIVVRGGTFEPRDMVVAVTRPIEEGLSGVIDLRRIRTRTVRGAAELSLDFRPGADMQYALQQVQGRLGTLQSELPANLEVAAERLTPSVFPMMQFELIGGDPIVLRDIAQYTIRPRLARLPDVGEVEAQGGRVREISVVLDPAALVSHHIGVNEVATAIQNANVISAAGRIDREYRQFSIVVSDLATTPEAIGELVVRREGSASVRVRDLGQVSVGSADQFEIATGNGEPAALINVSRQPNGSMLRVEDAVNATIDSLRPLLPPGVRLESVYNQPELVRDSLATIRDAMLLGGALAVVVLFVFLGRLKITLVAALTLPLAIVGSFAGMYLFGDSLNLMSMGGLAVAIGLVIDDAVVVVENIERHLTMHRDQATDRSTVAAVEEIIAPVTGSTLTTVVVFTPLGLLEGVVGQFFRSFSLALAMAVLLSLVYAIALIPALAPLALKGNDEHAPRRFRWFPISLAPVERFYTRTVRRALARPWLALVAALVMGIAIMGVWPLVGTGFLPEMDEGGFILDYWTPTGTSLAETDRQLHQLEAILKDDPAIQGFTRRTGIELGLFATAPNTGDMTVLLKAPGDRDPIYQVIDRIRVRVQTELPATRIEFVQVLQDLLGDLTGAPNPVEIKLFHPDVRTAETAASAVADTIESVPGLEDLFNGVQGDLPEVKAQLDPVRVARLGLTPDDVVTQSRAGLFGGDAGSVREPDRLVPIRVRLPDSVRFRADITSTLPVIGPNGWAPLGQLGRVTDTTEVSELVRENLRSMVVVTGAIDNQVSDLGSVMKEIRTRVGGVPLPPGVTLEYGGLDASQRESFRQLLVVAALAVGAVLLVMVGQFGSFRGPLMILLAASLGLTGAIVALAVTGIPFNVSSFMGLILLIGLIVKNGIIFLDAAHHARARGLAPEEALVEAGQIRLRPILMTTLCTLAGLFPLALGLGAGAELQRPLAVAVIGGLTLSTVVTLVLLPVGLKVVRAVD
ncbi:MAG: efflux RND transporter permease subunit [Gemmatimonadota bacterium]